MSTFKIRIFNTVFLLVIAVAVQAQCSNITIPEIRIDGGLFNNHLIDGASIDLCESSSYTVLGNLPDSSEAAAWTILSGSNISIIENSNTTQALIVSGPGSTEVMWEIMDLNGQCPSVMKSVVFTVHSNPISSLNLSSTDTCEGATVVAQGGVLGVTDLGTWTASGASTIPNGQENQPSFTFIPTVGTTTLTYTVENDGCGAVTSSESLMIEAVSSPVVAIDYNGSTTMCEPASLFLTTIHGGGGASPSYVWRVNSDTLGTSSSLNLQELTTGFQTIEVTLISSIKCVTSNTASDQITIIVIDGPTPQIAQNDTTACASSSVVLTADHDQGILQWFTNTGAIPGETGSSLTVTSAGAYYYSEDIGTCPPVISNQVVVSFETVPTAIAMDDVSLSWWSTNEVSLSGAVNTANWHWLDEDGQAFGHNQNPYVHQLSSGGTHVFTLLAEGNLCPDASDEVVVELTTVSVEDEANENDISLYPNPTSSDLWVEGVQDGAPFQLYSGQGVMMKTGIVSSGKVTLENLTPGNYLLEIGDDIQRKLVIE